MSESSREVAVQGPTRSSGTATPTRPGPPAGPVSPGPTAATPAAPMTSPGPAAPPAGTAPAPALSARVRRPRRVLLAAIVVAVLAQVAGFTGTYLGYSRHYVTTSNAQVDGDQITLNAPTTGIVAGWTGTEGTTMSARQVLGHIIVQDGQERPGNAIKAPGPGTISVSTAVNGQYIRAGSLMAVGYNPARTYVTARVNDTDSGRIRVNQPVDITVDAYPGRHVGGLVEVAQTSSAGEFTSYPSPDLDPMNPQKIQQYVPVRVAFTSTGGLTLMPGMNVTVHIRTDS